VELGQVPAVGDVLHHREELGDAERQQQRIRVVATSGCCPRCGKELDQAIDKRALRMLRRRRAVGLALHRRGSAAAGVAVEQRLGTLALHDGIGHLVCVLLVDITALADGTLELDAAALLDDVGCLVRRRVETWGGGESDMVPGRVRLGTDRPACGSGLAVYVGLHAADVVTAEQLLDRGHMGQPATGSNDPLRSRSLNLLAVKARERR
jgi:hypothetical protein